MTKEPVFSFCIRSLHPTVSENNIHDALQHIAVISSIDFVNKNTKPNYDTDTSSFKMAFIHLEKWICRQDYVDNFVMNVNGPDGLKIYYNYNHYFILRENLNPIFKRESRVKVLERENASLYKEIHALKLQVDKQTHASVKLPNISTVEPLKKKFKKKQKDKQNKQSDKDFEEYLYITTDEEDNNIHMNVILGDELGGYVLDETKNLKKS